MTDVPSSVPFVLTVEARAHGWRVDHYLARLYPNYSRAQFQKAIEQDAILVNGLPVKTSRRLRVNDIVSVRLPGPAHESIRPEEIPLEIIFEDDFLVVINKRAGMIVHPGKGNYGGTLAAALQFHFDRLSDAAGALRPGIVHRLDRDTSGLLIVAKNNQVHFRLSAQFERRTVAKEYRAVVWGVVERDSDVIDTYVRVNPHHREKMMVCEPGGNARNAVTHYEVIERFEHFSDLRLFPKTGRTHQLRVHLAHLGHPIVADRLYGGRTELLPSELHQHRSAAPRRRKSSKRESPEPAETPLIARQALHAHRLTFRHPHDDRELVFEAPLPDDIQATLAALRHAEALRNAPGNEML
jgi:23S rRNA pseudouridine1911/1915/1917 synthase